ncbi:MAG TPA: alkaline phosphatase family protein [Solirubrobacteraceae bacterium]|nr:alkaline phosphatase family protein [Solirubrobacteraceae bacterium]
MSTPPARPPKLVLAVIDGCKPAMLERAIEAGRAPVLAEIRRRGSYTDRCTAAFPSVTPVCAASIATGVNQETHHIPSMNWYHREERRYVEYGSSFSAARRFGFAQQLTDTVYNMNRSHLAADALTVFERLDDAGVRTAGTTYLMYRGRHVHDVARDTALTRLASAAGFRDSVLGPRELFYADIFASRRTGCRSQLGMPGVRDRHAGCVGAYLVEHDLFDFLLLSLPDNDWHSHKHGPHAQVDSIAEADRQLGRVAQAAGGIEPFLAGYAVIAVADHSHTMVEKAIRIFDQLSDFATLQPPRRVPQPPSRSPEEAEIAVCPAQRSAMIYVLVPEAREVLLPRLVEHCRTVEGVDLVMWLDRASGQGVIADDTRELRFAPGGDVVDDRGGRWRVQGSLATLGARVKQGHLESPAYPDALQRVWSALTCPSSGDVALSAGPGYEFLDWGGQAHVGGGSHGSLHASDSHGALLYCGVEPPGGQAPKCWSIRDVAAMVTEHFGVQA